MPTQEERLASLEKDFATFRKETAANTQELKENSTILLGLIYEERRDIRGVIERLDRLETRFDGLESRFSNLETGFSEHTRLLHQILARLPEPR